MIDLVEHADGIVLSLHARPKARCSAIIGEYAGRLKVAVTAPPEKGRANAAILDLLADELRLKRSQLTLLSGASSNRKAVLVADIDRDELRRRVAEQLAG